MSLAVQRVVCAFILLFLFLPTYNVQLYLCVYAHIRQLYIWEVLKTGSLSGSFYKGAVLPRREPNLENYTPINHFQ